MSNRQVILLNAGVLLVYFAAGKFGLAFFGLIHPSASAVWLPTGVAIAAFLLYGLRLVPAVFVGAFLVNETTAGSIPSSLGVALGNTLEGIVAVTLVERFAGGREAFATAPGILKFAGLAALLSTTVSATIGVASLSLGGFVPAGNTTEVWFTWWLGDAAGAVLVTPLIVLWSLDRSSEASKPKTQEAALLFLAITAIGAAVFFHPALAEYPMAFLCLPPLVIAALRFAPRETATAVALLAVIATAATATGRGPFLLATANESLLVLQAFLALIALTALPMSALTVERRASLERERAARAEADAALRTKDEFIAILSHELRNPLAAISTAAAVLDSGKASQSDIAPLVASIRRQVHHLGRLMEDLLDIGRIASNKLSLHKEPLAFGRAVRSCVEALVATRGLAADRIQLDLQPVWIEADPMRVTQIVENLIGNALKYTPVGRRIHVRLRAVDGVAELQVRDEGFGIPPELLRKVFEPFTQAQQGLARSAGGLGLGLTLVRRLTELHGGTIEARSDGIDRGSTFTLRFRRLPTPDVIRLETEDHSPANRTRRLLIVEDNPDARFALRALLETFGHEVHEANDGEAGVAAARAVRPDVVLIDVGLPRLDGYEVARRVKAEMGGIRLVALTGYGQSEDVQRARDAGFDCHLVKPASAEQLRAAIGADD